MGNDLPGFKTGLHEGIPFSEYQKIDAANHSRLSLLEKAPLFLLHADRQERRQSKEQRFGELAHCAVLEPERYAKRYYHAPKLDRRKTEDKKEAERLALAHHGLTEVDYETAYQVKSVAAAVSEHPVVQAYLTKRSKRELTVVWKDEHSQVLCKGRLDAYDEEAALIIDLKTTKDASPKNFTKSVWQYGYYRQAAWYRDGLRALGKPAQHCLVIAVEKAEPYAVCCYRVLDSVLDLAKKQNQELLHEYGRCKRQNVWPGYPEEVLDIGIPAWGLKELQENFGEPFDGN